jgi:hypothetical protein
MDEPRCRQSQRYAARAWRYALCAAATLLVAGCASGQSSDVGQAGAATAASVTASASPSPSPVLTPSASPSASATPIDPGLLPQTHVLPHTSDPMFQAGVQELWQAIVRDDPAQALPFFFPKSAYLQVKAISNASADYQNRLIAWYRLDIHAAHLLLGSQASSAQLVGVTVPQGQAVWITPGVEYNKGSYYRVYGTRLTYRIGGRTASFGIFSLISWRGEWYVVHLGPSTRSTAGGIVYAPRG